MSKSRLLLIIGGYAAVACAYIVLSDLVIFWLWPGAEQVLAVGTAKGIVFVLLTALALYFLLYRLQHTSRRADAAESANQTLINLVPKFFTTLPVVVYVLEPRDNKIVPVWISDNVKTILGYSVSEALEPGWWGAHVHPEDKQSASIETRLEHGHASYEYRFQRADGTYIWIQEEMQVARSRDSGPVRIVGAWTDISDRHEAQRLSEEYAHQLEKAMLDTVGAISAMVEQRDPYTAGHQNRVGEVAAAIATEMGLSEDFQLGLRAAGRVHDVGKISVPGEILSKPTRLTAGEYELIKGHSESGYQILKGIDFPWPVAEVVRQHHERMDGSGYPQGLKGDQILLEARIIAIADVVESMASHRPYRTSLGIDCALAEIETNAGRLYDAGVAAACLRLFRDRNYAIPE